MQSVMRKRTNSFILSVLKEAKGLSLWYQMRALNLMPDDFLKLYPSNKNKQINDWHKYGGNVLNTPLRQCAKFRHLSNSHEKAEKIGDVFIVHERGLGDEPETIYARHEKCPIWFVFMDEELLFEHQKDFRYILNLSMPSLLGNKSHVFVSVNGYININDVVSVVNDIVNNLKSFKRRNGIWMFKNGKWEKKQTLKMKRSSPEYFDHPVINFIAQHPEIPQYYQFLFFCMSLKPDFIPMLNKDREIINKFQMLFNKH